LSRFSLLSSNELQQHFSYDTVQLRVSGTAEEWKENEENDWEKEGIAAERAAVVVKRPRAMASDAVCRQTSRAGVCQPLITGACS